MMAQIVYFKEWLIVFYKKHVDVVLPVLKLVFAFFTMCMFQGMFPYNMVINKPGTLLVLSAAQAFLQHGDPFPHETYRMRQAVRVADKTIDEKARQHRRRG